MCLPCDSKGLQGLGTSGLCFFGDWWDEQRQKQCDLHAEEWGRKQLLCANLKSECVKMWEGLPEVPCGAAPPPCCLHPWLQLLARQSIKSQGSEACSGACAGIELVLVFAQTLPDSPLLVCGIQARPKQAQPGFGSPGASVSPQRACSQSAPAGKWFGMCVGSCPISLCTL